MILYSAHNVYFCDKYDFQNKELTFPYSALINWLLGSLAKLQKATINVVISVCPSAYPHATNRPPLYGFSWNLMFGIFRKYVEKTEDSLISKKNIWYFTWDRHTFVIISRSVSSKWEKFLAEFVEKIKTHTVYSASFYENRDFYEIMRKNMVKPDMPQMAV
jgi:hypothetical protein